MDAGVTIDLGSLAQWASAAAGVVALGISIFTIFRSSRKTELNLVHSRVSTLKTTVTDQGERLARVETMLDHLPTREMVARLETTLERVSGDVRVGNASYQGLVKQIDGIGTALEQLIENELRGTKP